MTKHFYIALLALGLCACSSTQSVPLDDAYFYPDGREQVSAQPAPTVQPAQPAQPAQTKQVYEIINQQDTTVTIRIKR
jgi:hypothetical protein